jgi:hypothetical protein
LVAKQVHAGAPMNPSTPILPEKRFPSDDEGMEQHADLTRLCRGGTIPLALLA